jgi:hypothetical protein
VVGIWKSAIEHTWHGCSEIIKRQRKERGETLNEDGREIRWMNEI